MAQVRKFFLIQLIRNDCILNLLFMGFYCLTCFGFVLFYEVKNFPFVEENGYDLKIGLSIDVEEVQHDVLLRDAVNYLLNVLSPSLLWNVAIRKSLTVQEQSDYPKDLVPEINLTLFSSQSFYGVLGHIFNLSYLFNTSRVRLLGLSIQVK